MIEIKEIHPWNLGLEEAKDIQKRLKKKICLTDQFTNIKFVAGVDVGFSNKSNLCRAAVTILSFPELNLIEAVTADSEILFPYIPGYLSFREIPVIIKAFERVSKIPDLIICDGQGIAHPRHFGIACHLGLLLDLPTIGAAKKKLYGIHESLPEEKGKYVFLYDKDVKIGAVLRTREKIKPVYVSPGHKISVESSIKYILNCITKYRLPETTRYAHKYSLIKTSEF